MSEPDQGGRPSRISAHRRRRLAGLLAAGGVIAHATEGVWGLACDPFNRDAIDRILALKQRDAARGLIVIGAAAEQLAPFVAAHAEAEFGRALADWPSATTWLLPAAAGLPVELTGDHATIALRMTAHAESAALCRAFGPLVSTSANVSGRPPVRSAWQARARFGSGVDAIAGGRCDTPGRASTIRDAASGDTLRN